MKFLQLIRWRNLAIVALVQGFVYLFLNQTRCIMPIWDYELVLLALSTLFIAAAGYLINDYSDIKIDVVNKPEKLIVSRYISRRMVLILYIVFNLIGFALGYKLNRYLGLLDLGIIFLLWQYSVRYKYMFLLGNVIVAGLMALSVLVVYFAQPDVLFDWLLFYTFFAFLTGLIREVIKDIEDQEGDSRYGAKTLPNVLGLYKTKVVLYYVSAAQIILLGFACIYLFYKHYLVLPVYLLLFTIAPAVALWVYLVKADKKQQFSKMSSYLKLVMLLGIVSMALRCIKF